MEVSAGKRKEERRKKKEERKGMEGWRVEG